MLSLKVAPTGLQSSAFEHGVRKYEIEPPKQTRSVATWTVAARVFLQQRRPALSLNLFVLSQSFVLSSAVCQTKSVFFP